MRPRQFWGPYRLAEALFLKGDLEGSPKTRRQRREPGVAIQLG